MSGVVEEERKQPKTYTDGMKEIKELVEKEIESLRNLQRENNDVETTKDEEEEEEIITNESEYNEREDEKGEEESEDDSKDQDVLGVNKKGREEVNERVIVKKIVEEKVWEIDKKISDEKNRVQLKLKEKQRRKKERNKRIWNPLI